MATMLIKVNDTNQSCLHKHFEILFQGNSDHIKSFKNVFCPVNIPAIHIGTNSNTLLSPMAIPRRFS